MSMTKQEMQEISDAVTRGVMIPKKEMLTMEEAILYTGLKRDYLYKLTSQRQIPFYKPAGRAIFFRRAELDNWIKQGRVESMAELNDKVIHYTLTTPLPGVGALKSRRRKAL